MISRFDETSRSNLTVGKPFRAFDIVISDNLAFWNCEELLASFLRTWLDL